MLNVELLKQTIKDSGLKKSAICKALGTSYTGLWRKMQCQNEFTVNDILILCDLLKINSNRKRNAIFFARKVGK